MVDEVGKQEAPPYVTYKTFSNFINGLRDTGTPSRIDKSVISTLSGSTQSALLAALKWLHLIDDAGIPTAKLQALVDADASKYSEALRSILESAYGFMTDGSINLANGTGGQLEAKIREYGPNGSTVIKCMAFFISAAREAQVQLGVHIKAPKVVSSGGAKKRPKKTSTTAQNGGMADEEEDEDGDPNGIPDAQPGFVKIPIPLHGMADGAVYLPDNLTPVQWRHAIKITQFLIENYRPSEENDDSAKGLV